MRKFYTPEDIARVLTQHAPRKIEVLLEPASGDGSLTAPFVPRVSSGGEIVCVDTDRGALTALRSKLEAECRNRGVGLQTVAADFLSYSDRVRDATFDCVVMNPPFAARLADWKPHPRQTVEEGRLMPVEAAFTDRAIRVLKPGGRLLAVVPSSIVAAKRLKWFREDLLRRGTILYVHELSKFTFKGVEGRTYLFVFEKKESKSKNIKLSNREILKPEYLTIATKDLGESLRLDYGYHRQQQRISTLISRNDSHEWHKIGDLYDIYRGLVSFENGDDRAIHTAHYNSGFWLAPEIQRAKNGVPRCDHKRDLLIKRVGRHCGSGMGIPTRTCEGKEITDCVFLLKPKMPVDRVAFLLGYRALYDPAGFVRLIEQGTGASYITKTCLEDAPVPILRGRFFETAMDEYAYALRRRARNGLRQIEQKVRSQLVQNAD